VVEYYNTSKAMREYQHKHMIRTLVYSKVTLLILFLLTVLLIRSIVELNIKRRDVVLLRDESQKEKEEFQRKVEDARIQTETIQTDRGFESYVRTTYPVVKEDEGVIVIYEEGKNPVSTVRTEMTLLEKINVLWNNLFNN
jgi:hypothetical protein